MINQLKVLIPDRTFTTSGGEILLKPFKFKQFQQALEIVEKYLSMFTQFDTSADIAKALFTKAEENYAVLGDICALLSLVGNVTTETLNELQYDEVLGLLVEVIDMNMDFFGRIGERLKAPTDETANGKAKTGEFASVG